MALFDYDPPTMSPNPEACDEELPFREGQLIKVKMFLLFKYLYFENVFFRLLGRKMLMDSTGEKLVVIRVMFLAIWYQKYKLTMIE